VIDSAEATFMRQTGYDPTQPLSTGAGFQVKLAKGVPLVDAHPDRDGAFVDAFIDDMLAS
jgi:hypothetical protein